MLDQKGKFLFFGELIELGSKLGLQRAQFLSWLNELDFYANSQSVIYPLLENPLPKGLDSSGLKVYH